MKAVSKAMFVLALLIMLTTVASVVGFEKPDLAYSFPALDNVPLPGQGNVGDLLATFNLVASRFAEHPTLSRIYASIPASSVVAVIDSDALAIVTTIPVHAGPRGLSLNQDGSRLYVACANSSYVDVIDTTTNQKISDIIFPTLPSDVEFGSGNRLYVTPASQSVSGIMYYDLDDSQYLGAFSFGVSVYSNGYVEISPDRNRLWFANVGISPGTLAVYNVSGSTPSLIWKNDHGDLGSNGQGLALSNNGNYVSYPVGGGNVNGYNIAKIRTNDFLIDCLFVTGAYPREITYSPDDVVAYTVHGSGRIDIFDALTCSANGFITTSGEATELHVDRSGRYLFAAFSNQTRVYNTGRDLTGPPDCNHNGIDDAIDIAEGSSHDCNGNEKPDECEYVSYECPFQFGDVNNDGVIAGDDLRQFLLVLLNFDRCGCSGQTADITPQDGLSPADIDYFVDRLCCNYGLDPAAFANENRFKTLSQLAHYLDVELDLSLLLQ